MEYKPGYSTSISAGARIVRSCRELSFGKVAREARQPRCDKLHQLRIARWGGDGAAFDRIDYRLRGEVPDENFTGFSVNVTGSRADLVIGVGGYILHEEIQNPRVALEHSEQLERSVFRSYDRRRGRLGSGRWGLGGEAEFRYQIFRQFAAE